MGAATAVEMQTSQAPPLLHGILLVLIRLEGRAEIDPATAPLAAVVGDRLYEALPPELQEAVDARLVKLAEEEEAERLKREEAERARQRRVVDEEQEAREDAAQEARWEAWFKRAAPRLDERLHSRAPQLRGRTEAWAAVDGSGGVWATGATRQAAWARAMEDAFRLSIGLPPNAKDAINAFSEPPPDGPDGEVRLVYPERENGRRPRVLYGPRAMVKIVGPAWLVERVAEAIEGAGL